MDSRRARVVAASSSLLALAAAVSVVAGDLSADVRGWILAADVGGGLLACALVWFCRRQPFWVGLAVVALSAGSAAASAGAGIATVFAALYLRPRQAVLVGTASLAATLVRFAWRPPGLAPYSVWALVAVLFTGVLTGWGMLAHTRRELMASLEERAVRAEAAQRQRTEEARQAERVRIAREMHDVLAHRLSMLALQAGALEFNPQGPPSELAEAAGVVRSNAQLAMKELREVISVLREEQAPVLGDLDALLAEARAFGEVTLCGNPDGVPAAVGRTAYRVVQEGLTNARKHAPGAAVTVELDGAPGDGLTVEITNLFPKTSADGVGLVGLGERVALMGGRLEHGAVGGSFVLKAWLPWPR